jgi:HD-GYP domain-containing protein (c-di-GMP phosphodiesterase class II)
MSEKIDVGLELLVRMNAILRTGRAYSVTNEVFHRQLQAFAAALRPILADQGEVVLAAFEEGLYLNGVRITTRAGDYRHYRALLEELARRRLGALQVRGDAPVEEWQAFFELFLDPDRYSGAAFLEACRERGLVHVVPALHASSDANYEPGRGEGGGGADGEAPGAAAGHGGTGSAAAAPGTAGGRAVEDASLAGRVGAAPKRYAQAIAGMRSLLTSTTLQSGLELRHVKRVVQPIVDDVLDGKPVLLGLAGLSQRDEFTYARSVNACLIAVTIGHRLGLGRQALADLAAAALLHDVGRGSAPDPARVGVEGARRIAAAARFGPTTLRCLEAALDGRTRLVSSTGALAPGDEDASRSRGLVARIVAIADTYVRLVSHRSELGRALTPHQALGMVLGPLADHFEPGLRLALVESLGFYPPGQFVELDGGEIAAVVASLGDDLARPIVRLVSGPGGGPLPTGEFWEGGPVPPERWIRRALKAEEYPEPDARAA